ncbi:MAG TPA: AAA family ATPase, partial [Terriglobales bacterium]|nr:AAA family ATPase [Terriglobales bacterium]
MTPAAPAAETPLVGRDTELVALRERLTLAARGKGQVAVITGEAGIGKSRLVAELASDASARGIRVLLGRAHETEQILPFRPWIDALRAGRALVDLDGGARARATRTELVRLFPELAGGSGGAPTITNESHVRLFESLDAVIDELAMTTPLLVIIEDLHWADDMTLRLLPFIGRRLAGRRVVLACTAREEDATPGVQRTMREMAALPHVTPVALGALSKDATAALVRALARSGSPDARLADTIERVWELSEGSPFVIVETVRALRDARLPDARDVGLPQRVRDLIAARIARLSPRAQELARIAAVFTRSFEFPVLQRAAGLARRETAEAVEELVRQRIVDAVGERFDFTHARIRQAVGDSLLAPRRQALHAAIGEAVETVYAGRLEDSYERLAYHFSRADEPARALTYLVHLADKVARSYALEEAVRVLHEALPFTDRIPSPERERRRVDVVYRLGHVLMLLGRSAEARDLLTNHEAMVASLRDPSTSGAFHFWLAHAYGNLGEGASGLHHGQRALEEAARGGDELMMGRANFVLARETYMAGRALEGIAHGRQAVALLERHRDQWWLGQAIYILALNLLHVGDFTTALEVADRGFALGETNGDTRLLAYAAGIAARVHTVMGEVDAAIGTAQRSAAFASDPVARLTAVGWLGAAYQEGGDSSRAITFLEDALGDLQALSGGGGYRYRQIDAFLRATLSEAYLDQGDVARAHDIASAAVAAATEGGWAVAIGYAARATGRALLAAGKVDEAEAAVRQALRAFADAATHAQVARTRLALAEVMAARGDAAAARAELGTAREAFVHMRAPVLVER